jgi:TetR/AcrR family transcriptional regulator, cholesterol catabolism regulator
MSNNAISPGDRAPVEQSRRERKKDETRHRIFHAAIDLFRERGFENTTVDDITERADVARGTFFNYFPRKDAVLAFLSETRLLAAEESAPALLADQRPAPDKIVDLYLANAAAYEEHPELSRYVLLELMGRAFAPSEDLSLRWQEQIVRLVRQGQERGELPRPQDPARIEALLTGMHFATLYQWACLCPEQPFPLPDELRYRLQVVLKGLRR